MPATQRLQPDQQQQKEHSSSHGGLVQCTEHDRGAKSDAVNVPRLSSLHGFVHNRSVCVVMQLCSCVCIGVRVGGWVWVCVFGSLLGMEG
jgi:hypothetical protein